MKTIKLENKAIVPVFSFLQEVSLKGKASRGRTQFSKRLEEKNKEFNEALKEIRKEYFKVDGDGELIVENGEFITKDKTKNKELDERIQELDEELVEIHFGEYSTKYDAMFTALDTIEEELSGQRAYGYNELMDAYEVNEENTNTQEEK